MEHVRDYVERLKSQPADHRRRVAFGASLALALLIGLGWMTALVSSGTLALSSPAHSEENAQLTKAAASASNQFSGLLGAASAYQSQGTDQGGVTVVDEGSSTTLDSGNAQDGRTVIPF